MPIDRYWFRKGGDSLERHGSWGQKYIGDSIMSVWVHEDKKESSEMRAIFQALVSLFEMTAGLQGMFELGEAVKIGAGINTGYATVGNAGSAQLTDYTALGDTVNLTFRLESACKEAHVAVIIGANSYAALNNDSSATACFHPLAVPLKGYERPRSVWGARFSDLQNVINGWSVVTSDADLDSAMGCRQGFRSSNGTREVGNSVNAQVSANPLLVPVSEGSNPGFVERYNGDIS